MARKPGDRRADLKRRYGITPEEYDEMAFQQGGYCAICRKPCATGRNLAVDHDHATGKVRGLLCYPCNRAVGWYEHDPKKVERLLKYMALHKRDKEEVR